jgi:hypothetical protein
MCVCVWAYEKYSVVIYIKFIIHINYAYRIYNWMNIFTQKSVM